MKITKEGIGVVPIGFVNLEETDIASEFGTEHGILFVCSKSFQKKFKGRSGLLFFADKKPRGKNGRQKSKRK